MQVGLIIAINAIYVSTIAILRIPVNEYIISIGVLVYVVSLFTPVLYLKSKKD